MTDIDQLGTLIAMLPPPPAGLVEAAQTLPRLRRELDGLLARAEADAAFRARLEADLEAALAEAGIEPMPWIVDEARARMRAF